MGIKWQLFFPGLQPTAYTFLCLPGPWLPHNSRKGQNLLWLGISGHTGQTCLSKWIWSQGQRLNNLLITSRITLLMSLSTYWVICRGSEQRPQVGIFSSSLNPLPHPLIIILFLGRHRKYMNFSTDWLLSVKNNISQREHSYFQNLRKQNVDCREKHSFSLGS